MERGSSATQPGPTFALDGEQWEKPVLRPASDGDAFTDQNSPETRGWSCLHGSGLKTAPLFLISVQGVIRSSAQTRGIVYSHNSGLITVELQ